MKCPKCNAEIDNNAKFCPNCGNMIEIIKYCPNCGSILNENNKFCPNCGTSCSNQNSVQQTSEQGNQLNSTESQNEKSQCSQEFQTGINIFSVTPVEYFVCTLFYDDLSSGEPTEITMATSEDVYGIATKRSRELLTFVKQIYEKEETIEPNYNIKVQIDDETLIKSLPFVLRQFSNKKDKLVHPFISPTIIETIRIKHILANDSTVLYYRIINDDKTLIITTKEVSYYDTGNITKIEWSDFRGLTKEYDTFVFESFHNNNIILDSYDVLKMTIDDEPFVNTINSIAWANAEWDDETKYSHLPSSDATINAILEKTYEKVNGGYDQKYDSITDAIYNCVFNDVGYISKGQVIWSIIGIPFYLITLYSILILFFLIGDLLFGNPSPVWERIFIIVGIIIGYKLLLLPLVLFFKMLKRRIEYKSDDNDNIVVISFGGIDWIWIVGVIFFIILFIIDPF